MTEQATHLQHHFVDMDQQHEAATLGMWTFLGTEILFFGALFTGYTIYRLCYYGAWFEGSHHLIEAAGAINTAILLCSSMTMAFGVRAAQLDRTRQTTYFLLVTILLGLAFLGIKGWEYQHEWFEGLVPRYHFNNAEFGPKVQLFMCFYFIMTALHGFHMVVGVSMVSWVAWHAWKGRYLGNPNWVEMVGLYWHFVDIVWIFLFPLLYLIR